MRVRVGKLDPDATKDTQYGKIYRAQAEWEGYKRQWTSFYFQPTEGAEYESKITSREWNGKILWTVKEGQLVGAPAATQAQPAAETRTTGKPAPAKTTLPIMAELRAVGAIVKALKFESGEVESTTLNTALMEVFKRGAIERMAEYQHEEGARGGAPSSGDELPPDEELGDPNIPF